MGAVGFGGFASRSDCRLFAKRFRQYGGDFVYHGRDDLYCGNNLEAICCVAVAGGCRGGCIDESW